MNTNEQAVMSAVKRTFSFSVTESACQSGRRGCEASTGIRTRATFPGGDSQVRKEWLVSVLTPGGCAPNSQGWGELC